MLSSAQNVPSSSENGISPAIMANYAVFRVSILRFRDHGFHMALTMGNYARKNDQDSSIGGAILSISNTHMFREFF